MQELFLFFYATKKFYYLIFTTLNIDILFLYSYLRKKILYFRTGILMDFNHIFCSKALKFGKHLIVFHNWNIVYIHKAQKESKIAIGNVEYWNSLVVPGRVELPTHPCQGYVITVSPRNCFSHNKHLICIVKENKPYLFKKISKQLTRFRG